MQEIITKASEKDRRLRSQSAAELEHIIHQALEKDRELRFQNAAEMRSELLRLKRDGDAGRAIAASSGPAAVEQESGSRLTQPTVAQPPSPPSGSSPALARSPPSSAAKMTELPLAYRKVWRILVPAVVLIAVTIAGAFYFRSRQTSLPSLKFHVEGIGEKESLERQVPPPALHSERDDNLIREINDSGDYLPLHLRQF
jgi:hypothetical protein